MSRCLRMHFYRLLSSAKTASSEITKKISSSAGFSSVSARESANPRLAEPANLRFAVFASLSRQSASPSFNVGFNRTVPLKGLRASQGCRFFHLDSRGYEHFQRSGFGAPHGKNRARMYTIIVITLGGFCTLIYASHQEIVPYTYRKHFVLISPDFEAKLVENQFDAIKKQWKAQILPPIHPQAVRVRKIAKDVIRAVMEGTRTEDHARILGEGDRDKVVWGDHADTPVSTQWEGHDEVLDEQLLDKTRRKGMKEGAKPFVEHLKPAKWEVVVVDKDVVNAFCLPGGKIVVFTGLLKHFPSDAEIATVVGHEVAHVVARHSAERMTRHLFLTLVELFILAFFYAPDLVRSAGTLFLELPFSRRQELEADHIGLLLMAAAGYDPRVAPQLYEKLGKLGGSSDLLQYVTTHPSGNKRGERLRKTGAMEQAVNIYVEKAQGKAVEGFL